MGWTYASVGSLAEQLRWLQTESITQTNKSIYRRTEMTALNTVHSLTINACNIGQSLLAQAFLGAQPKNNFSQRISLILDLFI